MISESDAESIFFFEKSLKRLLLMVQKNKKQNSEKPRNLTTTVF